ncbi:MAG TPA: HEAT repeat domain-containing protein [Longimicrobiales bacterium]
MKNTTVLTLLTLLLGACGARQPATQTTALPDPEPVPDSVVWNADPELAPVLRRGYLTERETEAAERIAQYIGVNEYIERLGEIAYDTANPWVVRANALKLLSDYPAVAELIVFRTALRAREERLRMTAVSAMKNYLLAAPSSAIAMLEVALDDPSPRVQQKALEILSDRDIDVLRRYVARTRNAELRGVAIDLVRAAEERGAPLTAKDSAGTLQRTTSAGITLSFRPTQRWPHWDVAVGELRLQMPGKQPVVVASNVEVVGGVIPAFIAPDSGALFYEANREIRVRSLRDNSDRKLADGVAPRIFPFTNDVLFLREIGDRKTITPQGTPLRYEVVRMPLSGVGSKVIGQLGANAQNAVKGGASPVRWMRLREIDGRFYLVGETIKDFELPSPFGG